MMRLVDASALPSLGVAATVVEVLVVVMEFELEYKRRWRNFPVKMALLIEQIDVCFRHSRCCLGCRVGELVAESNDQRTWTEDRTSKYLLLIQRFVCPEAHGKLTFCARSITDGSFKRSLAF